MAKIAASALAHSRLQVIQGMGLAKVPLFGLQYVDKKAYETFLTLEKKARCRCCCCCCCCCALFSRGADALFPTGPAQILSQDITKEDPLNLWFLAKFYPESVNEELSHPHIQRLFWLQIRDDIVADRIYVPAELCVLFAAQTVRHCYLAA